jgi:hypothetical protein
LLKTWSPGKPYRDTPCRNTIHVYLHCGTCTCNSQNISVKFTRVCWTAWQGLCAFRLCCHDYPAIILLSSNFEPCTENVLYLKM